MIATGLSLWARLGLISSCGVAAGLVAYGVACSPELRERVLRYTQSLDAPLRRMLQPAYGSVLLASQIALGLGCAAAALLLHTLWPALLIALIMPAPKMIIAYLQRRRCRRIEEKLDVFALALANATRATPSIGRALQLLLPTLTSPFEGEIEQVLREMKVGSSAEQALLTLSWRVQSPVLDALLSNVLVARRVGGELPVVLETTASTLREMARLEGVLRSKTAQSRAQLWVMCSLPILLVMAFDAAKPGYFDPLTHSAVGMALLLGAAVLWLSAILMARRILAVQL